MDFSARSSALGYFYQARFALFLLLNADRDETELAIEKLDDISFEEHGTPVELLQTKHHTKPAALTNSSVDLWKTLRIWSVKLAAGELKDDTILSLVTTSLTPEDVTSITRQLKPSMGRDNKHISNELLAVANHSTNQDLQAAFDAYRTLSEMQRERLVSMIQILDGSPDIIDAAEKIKRKLQVRPQYRDAVFTRLEGWWFERVVRHLRSSSNNTIKRLELVFALADITDQFRPEFLPIDYAGVEPPESPDPTNDQRRFVDQLRVIGLQNQQIANAIKDYFRAFEQRSRWEREQLLNIGELEAYERRLVDEWDRHRLWSVYDDTDELAMRRCGQELFRWAEQADIPIRPQVTEPYVMRGSFHILANEVSPRIWWHPMFVERLKALIAIPEPVTTWNKKPIEIRNLFNPAFCSILLHDAIKQFAQVKGEGMPYALLFLILPVILHKQTRETLPRGVGTKLHAWLNNNQNVRVGFADRTRELVAVTKEALTFGINQGNITLADTDDKFLSTGKRYKRNQRKRHEGIETSEINDIEKRARFVGRWYAEAGSVASIYVMWGVRP